MALVWTAQDPGFGTSSIRAFAYGGGTLVAGGDDAKIATSTDDGATWTTRSSNFGSTDKVAGLCYGSGIFVAVGGTGRIATSSDNGVTWVRRDDGTASYSLNAVAYGGGIFVAVGSSGTILTSPDGATWTSRTSGTTNALLCIAYGAGRFAAMGASGKLVQGTDGISWTSSTSGFGTSSIYGVTFSGSLFVAVGASGKIGTSTNGFSWTQRTSGTGDTLACIAWGDGRFVCPRFSSATTGLQSSDGTTWSSVEAAPGGFFNAIAFTGARYAVGGGSNSLYTGAVAVQGSVTGFGPASFGSPGNRRVQPVSGLSATSFGTPVVPAPEASIEQASGFSAGSFGAPSNLRRQAVASFTTTAFGTPEIVVGRAQGFAPIAFGQATNRLIQPASAWSTSAFGVAAGTQCYRAQGFGPTIISTAYTAFLQTTVAEPWAPVRFGQPTTVIGPSAERRQYAQAHSLRASNFGVPVATPRAIGGGAGWSLGLFGAPLSRLRQVASGWTSTQFGEPSWAMRGRASGCTSTHYGQPTSGRQQPATSLYRAPRFGRPTATILGGHTAYGFSGSRFGQPTGRQFFGNQATGFSSTQFGEPEGFEFFRVRAIPPDTRFGTPLLRRSPTC